MGVLTWAVGSMVGSLAGWLGEGEISRGIISKWIGERYFRWPSKWSLWLIDVMWGEVEKMAGGVG